MFGIEHSNVEPDIMFLAKPFANGLHMAGIIARKEIMAKEAKFPVVRGGSFAGGLIACVSAIATIEEIQDKELVKNSAEVGDHMLKRLKEISEKHELIGDVRGKGLLIGIELVKNKKPAGEEARKVVTGAFKRGLLVTNIGTYRQVIRLTPPLILSKDESDKAVEILDETIKEVEKRR
jgi:4-aminobutyrate aminotransferase